MGARHSPRARGAPGTQVQPRVARARGSAADAHRGDRAPNACLVIRRSVLASRRRGSTEPTPSAATAEGWSRACRPPRLRCAHRPFPRRSLALVPPHERPSQRAFPRSSHPSRSSRVLALDLLNPARWAPPRRHRQPGTRPRRETRLSAERPYVTPSFHAIDANPSREGRARRPLWRCSGRRSACRPTRSRSTTRRRARADR